MLIKSEYENCDGNIADRSADTVRGRDWCGCSLLMNTHLFGVLLGICVNEFTSSDRCSMFEIR
jgi:hypothetical protein